MSGLKSAVIDPITLDPREALRALAEGANGPAALAVGEVRAIVAMPIREGGPPLARAPGVYQDRGVALYREGDDWIVALEPACFIRHVRGQVAQRGGMPIDVVPTADLVLARVRPHPHFLGRVNPPDATHGDWYGVCVAHASPGRRQPRRAGGPHGDEPVLRADLPFQKRSPQ